MNLMIYETEDGFAVLHENADCLLQVRSDTDSLEEFKELITCIVVGEVHEGIHADVIDQSENDVAYYIEKNKLKLVAEIEDNEIYYYPFNWGILSERVFPV